MITGNKINGSQIIIKNDNNHYTKGLRLESGEEKWFNVLHFGDFNDELALIDDGKNTGYINRKGEFVIEKRFSFGTDFSEGRAFVNLKDEFILIDTNGRTIKKFDDTYLTSKFNEGFVRVSKIVNHGQSKVDGLINREGKFVIPFQYENEIENAFDLIDENDEFSCGLLRVKNSNKYGFVDSKNNWVIPFDFDEASKFSEGLAAVCIDNKYGFIDVNNKIIIPFLFEDARYFSDGIAAVKLNNKWGAIDKNLSVVIPFEFHNLGFHKSGEIPFSFNDEWGIMTKELRIVISCKYEKISNSVEGIYKVVYEGKEGFTCPERKEVISRFVLGSQYNLSN